MNTLSCRVALLLLMAFSTSCLSDANSTEDVYRLRLFFGLSLPEGGAVSLEQWQNFQNNEIATAFEGFNVVDSVGYYQGKPERSKIVTLIVKQPDINKAKSLASRYAKKFGQDSVMMVTVPVLEWEFIGPND